MSKEGDKPAGLLSGLRDAFGRGKRQVSEEEIIELVGDADELLDDEKRMIGEILSLGELTAADVMQPRVDIIAVEDDETVRAALERMRGTGYSRLPVFHEDLDRIVGIVRYKDLIPAVLDGETDAPVTEYIREALFVPETKDLLPLLSEMQTNRQQIAIVVDEYGGTDGLITVEDIVEEIVGEIEDEFDPDNKYLTQLSEREWLVDGRFSIDDARELGWPIEDSDAYETVAGFVLEIADKLPRPGDEFVREGYIFHVQSMRGRRVSMVRVIAPEKEEEDEKKDE